MVGRCLDRLAVNPEVLDLGIRVDIDRCYGVLGDLSCVGIAGHDIVAGPDGRVVERFNQSLKYEHLYREEIATVLGLGEHTDAYRELYNWVRPHEAIGFLAPMVRYLAEPLARHPEPNLSEPETVQIS